MEIRENTKKGTVVAKLNSTDVRCLTESRKIADLVQLRAKVPGVKQKAEALSKSLEAFGVSTDISLVEPEPPKPADKPEDKPTEQAASK